MYANGASRCWSDIPFLIQLIAIFKEPESYDFLKHCLSDITVDSTTFSLEYYLGGDWKFLALATGIDCASSDHACIWCKCPALERHSSALKWSISNPDLGQYPYVFEGRRHTNRPLHHKTKAT